MMKVCPVISGGGAGGATSGSVAKTDKNIALSLTKLRTKNLSNEDVRVEHIYSKWRRLRARLQIST